MGSAACAGAPSSKVSSVTRRVTGAVSRGSSTQLRSISGGFLLTIRDHLLQPIGPRRNPAARGRAGNCEIQGPRKRAPPAPLAPARGERGRGGAGGGGGGGAGRARPRGAGGGGGAREASRSSNKSRRARARGGRESRDG